MYPGCSTKSKKLAGLVAEQTPPGLLLGSVLAATRGREIQTMARPVNPRTRLDRIDKQLLLAMLLPRGEFWRAMERISVKEELSTRELRRRVRWLGLFRIEARMGAAALKKWETHCKSLARLYKSNLRLFAAITGRAGQIRKEIKEFEARTYSDQYVATQLKVGLTAVQFWADILGKLKRDERGRFTGQEIARFVEEDSYLIKGKRFTEANVPRGTL